MPLQKVNGPLGVILATVFGKRVVCTTDDVDLQPLAPVTVTLKFPLVSTENEGALIPLFQRIEVVALEVSKTELPGQNEIGPLALIIGIGGGVNAMILVD